MKRYLSRKFIISLGAVITGILIAVYPEQDDSIRSIVAQISGVTMAILVTMGYVVAQGSVDKAEMFNHGWSDEDDRGSGSGGNPVALIAACLLLPLAFASGCATNTAALPQDIGQKADDIGPSIVVNGLSIFISGGALKPWTKFANSIVISANDATLDGTQQGSTDQAARQKGGESGAQEAKAEPVLEIPLVP